MNRHIIIGFKKGASFKSDLGDLLGVAQSKIEAQQDAKKHIKKDYEYCMIISAKKPVAIVRQNSGVSGLVNLNTEINKAKAENKKEKAENKKEK